MTERGRKIILTEDGSYSVFDENTGESFHSHFGALSESEWIFIEAGYRFAAQNKSELSILEIGFGTGLNALLTSVYCLQDYKTVSYTALEAFPLTREITKELSYHKLVADPNAEGYFIALHSAEKEKVTINPFFDFTLINCKLEDWKTDNNRFDLVYFDAFSPEVQPELWIEDIFRKLFTVMNAGGILVTYSCKGTVKRALKAAGFLIEKLPGPKGKREILRALKPV